MAREIGKLSARAVGTIGRQGMHSDGGGLYLKIGPTHNRSWIFRFKLGGKSREMGLGAYPTITLADARLKALDCRRLLTDGIDPIEAKRAQKQRARLDAAKAITFDDCAQQYIEAHRAGWRNAKHIRQWENTLQMYARPIFGQMAVQAIDFDLVRKALEPIWYTRPETASRLRGRIESILDWAKVSGYRTGENPAQWRGNLDKALPARAKVRKVEHLAALSYSELPAFLKLLRAQGGISALALEFTILTAARTGEVIGAKWAEIDLAEKLWTVPADRMKRGAEHRVPLSDRVVAILEKLTELREGEFVFPGGKRGRPLSNMAMLKLQQRMGRHDITVHGYRSTFRDWCAETTDFPRDVVEMALAHTIDNKVEAAYRRGDLFEKRRQLMGKWEKYCT